MHNLFRRTFTYPGLALVGAVLWGLFEFVALLNARRTTKASASHSLPARADSTSINRAQHARE